MAITSGNLWQISFPYYLKATLPIDSIAFQHIDLNMKKYLEYGRGERCMQTSLTLTQEVAENCTFVIPGFLKVIRQWWVERVASDNLAIIDYGNNCIITNRVYLELDKAKCGDFVPAICGPRDIRISQSKILHDSTSNKDGKADNARLFVNTWFVSIQPDHEQQIFRNLVPGHRWQQIIVTWLLQRLHYQDKPTLMAFPSTDFLC